MATGWWALSTDGVEELFDDDLEHIAEMIKQGFTSGDLVQDGEETDTEGGEEVPTMEMLLDYPAVSQMTGLAVQSLRQYKADGKLPPPDAVIGGKSPLWTREAIDKWLSSRQPRLARHGLRISANGSSGVLLP